MVVHELSDQVSDVHPPPSTLQNGGICDPSTSQITVDGAVVCAGNRPTLDDDHTPLRHTPAQFWHHNIPESNLDL
jgi:hypothetical protein